MIYDDDDALADAWRRAIGRRVWAIAIGTLLVAAGCVALFDVSVWRKLAARRWPEVPARIVKSELVSEEPKAAFVLGKQCRITFQYGETREFVRSASQEVSAAWGAAHGISPQGYVYFRPPGTAPLPPVSCRVDPRDATVALLETSFTRHDALALAPLLVLAVGAAWATADARKLRRAGDALDRVRDRNAGTWRVNASAGSIRASTIEEVAIDVGALLIALVNFPSVTIDVVPAPLRWGGPFTVNVWASGAGRRRRRPRRIRIELRCGPFNTSGGRRRARHVASIVDAPIAPDAPATFSGTLPRRGDLPHDVDDVWLAVSARTRLGFWRTRPLWLAAVEATNR